MDHLLYWLDIGLLVIGGLIAVGWLTTWIARARNPLRDAPLRPNHIGPITVWLCITAFLLGSTLGAALGRRMAPSGLTNEVRDLYEGIIATSISASVSIVICLLVGRVAFTQGWRGMGIGRRPLSRDVAAAVPAVIASFSVCTGVAWVTEKLIHLVNRGFQPHEHSVFIVLHDARLPPGVHHLALWGALILAPISEELLFRGILQTAIQKLLILVNAKPSTPRETAGSSPVEGADASFDLRSDHPPLDQTEVLAYASAAGAERDSVRRRWIAIGVVAAIFGAMHGVTPQNIPALMVFGAILGYLYERTGSLTLPILVHLMFNGKSLLWDALAHL